MKIYFLMALSCLSLIYSAQELNENDFDKKNEIKMNVLDLVAAGSLGISYERFLKNNQSVSADVYLFDHFAYYDIASYDDYNSDAYSLKLAYNFYFSKNKEFKGFNFYPLMRFHSGKIKFEDVYFDGTTEKYEQNTGSFLMGFGLGYKWRMLNDRFTLGLNAELGRVLSGDIDTDFFSKVEFRSMLNLGFTF